MSAKETREALYAAIQDPHVRELAEQALGAAYSAGERHGWKAAIGYVQDGMCDYPSNLPESVGADALCHQMRGAGLAQVKHHASQGEAKTTCGYYDAAKSMTVGDMSLSTCPQCHSESFKPLLEPTETKHVLTDGGIGKLAALASGRN